MQISKQINAKGLVGLFTNKWFVSKGETVNWEITQGGSPFYICL